LEAVPHARSQALLVGLATGLVLALADCAATGIFLLPGSLALASLGLGACAGCAAGVIAAALRRPILAPALVLAGGIGLEGLSIASKELGGSARPIGALLVVLVALASLACTLFPRRVAWPSAALLGMVATLPAGSYLAARITDEPWGHLAGAALPVLALALARASGGRLANSGCVLAPLVLLAATVLERPAPPRPALPPLTVPPATGPSLVLLVIDTLRPDAIDPAGELAAFARQGTDFRQCVGAAPWTLPALSSLLTGLLPSQHGAVSALTPLADDVTTLAELLRANGYATAAFTGGAFVGTGHRLDQGFEHFDALCERRFAPFRTHVPLVWRLAKNRYFPLLWLVRWVDEVRGFEGVLAAARAWGERRRESRDERPFFLLLHTYQVHDYYIYDPQLDDAARRGRPGLSPRFAGRLSVHPSELLAASQADLDVFRALYQGRVRALEAELPELERWVSALAGENVAWMITADHGEGFDAARGRVHHGGRLHEDLLRVPLFLRAKGRFPEGRVVEETVRSVDVLPTALDLLGLAIPAGLAGESLLPALRGQRPFPISAFAEERAHGYELLTLRRDGWKWIRGPGHTELYHLTEDPLETEPLAGEPPSELRDELLSFPAHFPARARTEFELEDMLDPATLEQLRALGYVR
jgi:arylsulfatase A-like enzyme